MSTEYQEVVDGGTTPILSLRHISKYFGGVQALSNVDMDIWPGEVIILVGDNGAGKSTFLKVISGVNIPEEGEIFHKGKPVVIRNTLDPVKLGIQTVYQDLALCDNLDIVQNMFLGREITKNGCLNHSEMERIAEECLRDLGIEVASVRTKVGDLSGGQRQTVAIARAMLGAPEVVLLDEPYASLGIPQREQVNNLVLKLKAKNVGVVLVSHDLAEAFSIADRVVVFRLGEKTGEILREELTTEKVVMEITGSDSFMDEE